MVGSSIELVVHVWRYTTLLKMQIDSLRHISGIDLKYSIYTSMEDLDTLNYIRSLKREELPFKLNICYQPKELLFRRAIGRNEAAVASNSDLVWFCDVDYMITQSFLHGLSLLNIKSEGVCWPAYIFQTKTQEIGETLIQKYRDNSILTINIRDFDIKNVRKAIGGLQIVKGDVARAKGYVPPEADEYFEQYHEPASDWVRTKEDVIYRKYVGLGLQLEIGPLYRIRHKKRGGLDKGVII